MDLIEQADVVRPAFRPQTRAFLDNVVDQEEVIPALLIGSLTDQREVTPPLHHVLGFDRFAISPRQLASGNPPPQ
jgi:hypothetical protein